MPVLAVAIQHDEERRVRVGRERVRDAGAVLINCARTQASLS